MPRGKINANIIVNTKGFLYNESVAGIVYSYLLPQIFGNRGDKVQDDKKQMQGKDRNILKQYLSSKEGGNIL